MKKLIILSLVFLLVLSVAVPGMAKVVVNFWTRPSIKVEGLELGEYEQRIVDEFEALYPEVDIVLEMIAYISGQNKVDFNIAAGTPPDISCCNLANMLNHQNAGLLLDFEDILTAEYKAGFNEGVLDAISVDGKLYYYPMGSRPSCMAINRTIAEKAGALDLLPLDRPDRSWTAEEFKAYLIKVAEAKLPGIFSFVMNFADATSHHHWRIVLLQGFGAKMFTLIDGKYVCTVNSPEAAEGIKFYIDIYNNYPGVFPKGMENIGCLEADTLWCEGRLGSFGGALNVLINSRIKEDSENRGVTIVPYPTKEGIKNMVPTDWCGFEVFDTGDLERGKYAKLFVKYFVDNGPDLAGANYNTFPVHEDMAWPEVFKKYTDNIDFKWGMEYLPKYIVDTDSGTPVYKQFAEIFRATMQGVIIGELTAEEGLKIVEDKTNKALDEYYAE